MGKLQSKHVVRAREGPEGECFLHVNEKCGQYLAKYKMEKSELSLLDESRVPLQVVLPPSTRLDHANKLFTLDIDKDKNKELKKEKKEKEQEPERNKDPEAETTTSNNTTGGISVEEFECGVSVEGSDKQEWSFTLYNFDGHGKITKEDLASLLKSLYDAVGSSIKLPDTGAKTLKLRLQVTPDQTKVGQGETDSKEMKKENPNLDLVNRSLEKAVELAVEKSVAMDMSPEKPKGNDLSNPVNWITSTQHRKLAELVQQNMEQHHKRTQQVRRHHSDAMHHAEKHHKPKHITNRSKSNQERQDRRNYYLDLAGMENPKTLTALDTSAPAAVQYHKPHENFRCKNRVLRADQCKAHVHVSNKTAERNENSQELSEKVTKLQGEKDFVGDLQEKLLQSLRSDENSFLQSPKPTLRVTSTPKAHRHRPVSLPAQVHEEVSPHYNRRHRNRERNKSLAMQQVAEWIEKEHTFEEEREPVQRHEHYHVHEHHHHHHYHHYHET